MRADDHPPLEAWIDRARRQPGAADLGRSPKPLPAHVGLWLDRCWHEPEAKGRGDEEKRGRRALQRIAVESLQVDDSVAPAVKTYRCVLARWESMALAEEPGILRRTRLVEAKSRVLLHPASGATVTEGSVLLHHTYGVPYLPGAALKGLARRRAEAWLYKEPQVVKGLFGFERGGEADSSREDEAGLLDFWDALWVPPPSKKGGDTSPLALDIVNPHHSDYYTKNDRGDRFPDEREDPVPTHLLSIAPGTRFLVVVEVPLLGTAGAEWLDWTLREILLPALQDDGIGARTTSGYGRLAVVPSHAEDRGSRTPQPEGRSRERARVTYTRGSGGVLTATLPSGKPAEARGAEAQRLLGGLPEEVRARLLKGKDHQLDVEWTADGNARRIVGLGG